MSVIFLTGMPACGKSYWGEIFAKHYSWDFVDTDDYIMEKEGKTIAQIFDDKGEEGFRRIESSALKEIVNNNTGKTIIATGGGIVLSPENIDLMRTHGCVVYLHTPISVLVNRLEAIDNERPLLAKGKNIDVFLDELFKIRKHLYRQADYIFEHENISVINFEKILNKCTDRHSQ